MGDTPRKGRRRRARTAHTGVKLKQRSNGTWVARWIDPLNNAETQQSLDALGLSTAEARRSWAIAKAASLKGTKAAITSGKAVAARTSLARAVADFLAAIATKDSTRIRYGQCLARFEEWAGNAGIMQVQDVQPRHLAAYRDVVAKMTVATSAKGGRRGAKRRATRAISGATANKNLVVVKTFLGWSRRNGLTPHVDGDAIRDRLKPVRVGHDEIEILRPKQVRELLDAARRHDAATFAMTRAEHDGERPAGSTARYEPAAPFVLAVLLSGMRLTEVLELRWNEVDLHAGEIRLGASRTKTGRARTVTLAETPTLAALLAALRLRTPGDRVFAAWSADLAKATRKRLIDTFGAPAAFSWQALRRTCCAVLTCAPGVYGAASAFRSAKRAGHSVVVAEKHYTGLLASLPATAATFEDAVGIRDIGDRIVAAVGGGVEASAAHAMADAQ